MSASGRESVASSYSQRSNTHSTDGARPVFTHTSTPAVKPAQILRDFAGDRLEFRETLRARPIPTDTTERISSPEPSSIKLTSNRNVSSDSLRSQDSELGDLEEFVPEETHPGSVYQQVDTDDGHESFINDETQVLVDKAISYKYPSESLPSEDGSNIGLKKEKAVIDSLKQENFQLKLRIVIMETQLNSTSSAGVADLRKRLVDSEAARIAMKNDNDKLRKTLASLESDTEEKDQLKAQIQALQEDQSVFEQEREDFQQERLEYQEKEDELKVSFV